MLVSMVGMMKEAREKGYGIPALRAFDELSMRACIAAAEEKKSPLLIIAGFKMLPDICFFGEMCRELAFRTEVPIAVVLDHGSTYEHAVWAIRAGFTDIMVDRSTLPYEENAAQVKELVKIAHAVGVGVEAELGHVGQGANYSEDGVTGLTIPEEAVSYVAETGVDTLAVAIGTAHGVYSGVPKLRFDLLAELREKVPVPLVLHGGSGTGDKNLSRACQMGICKVNIANDLYMGALNALSGYDASKGAYRTFAYLSDGYKKAAMKYMDICGSSGRLASSTAKGGIGDHTSTDGLDESNP